MTKYVMQIDVTSIIQDGDVVEVTLPVIHSGQSFVVSLGRVRPLLELRKPR
jgi:hypothetical protein